METEIRISEELIINQIFIVRGEKVMLDSDLAELYGVSTKVLNQAVNRNLEKFPIDFMFQLSEEEWTNLKSQFVTSSWGGKRKLPYVFTELGIAMLSSVLSSKLAIQVNIQIVRKFVKIRRLLIDSKELRYEIELIKRQLNDNSTKVDTIFRQLDKLFEEKARMRNPVGFQQAGNRKL